MTSPVSHEIEGYGEPDGSKFPPDDRKAPDVVQPGLEQVIPGQREKIGGIDHWPKYGPDQGGVSKKLPN